MYILRQYVRMCVTVSIHRVSSVAAARGVAGHNRMSTAPLRVSVACAFKRTCVVGWLVGFIWIIRLLEQICH